MGRQAKLRKQRAAASTSNLDSSTPNTADSRSLWGKIRNFFSASQKPETALAETSDSNYTGENLRLLGAVAWEGYQTQRRGFVLVVSDSETPPQPTYIPRLSLGKTLRKYGINAEDIKTVNQFVSEYEPRKAAVLVYIDRDRHVSITKPTLELSPPECYELLRDEEED
ncbi:MAG: hypothetical protein SAJ12_06865 [Jaaginema sp. PMC 1079.18]|nr:hypothetical protein [Jaaginema sp. PMC 1080.18]MEC4850716.1 hypothetical protein [Jaaginema sp. PMC 1079.18]MEC4867731.1 hypothetical protein [Jaaginema sp. PMC 1078.18]